MARAIFLVFSNAASAEADTEFNRWYDDVHIPQILERVPGFVSGQRYVAAEGAGGAVTPAHRYLATYEMEAEDLDAVLVDMQKAITDGRMDLTDTLCLDPPPVMVMYRER